MNEHVKQLKDQAEFVGDRYALPDEFAEQFATLLIKDAISVLEKRFMGDLNREDMEVRRCVDALKKHFGVEE
jgi:hypothetical protein